MGNIDFNLDSPIRFEKKSNKIKIETDRISPNSCKIVEVGNLFRSNKVVVCVGRNSKDITIKPLKNRN